MLRRVFLIGGIFLASNEAVNARQSEERSRLVLATATPGGSFPAFGQALVEAVQTVDPSLTIELRMTKGSAENLELLKAGAVDLALVQGEYAYTALAADRAAATALTVVGPVSSSPGLFVVMAASPIRNVADLRGKAVALGTHASGLTVMGRTVLKGSGIDPAHDIQPILLDHAGDGATMVLDGRAAALWGAGIGWPGFKVLADAPGGARFFGPAHEAIAKILEFSPYLRRVTVPAGTLKDQEAAIDTVGSWSFILARAGVDSDLVTRLVRAMDLGNPALAKRYSQGDDAHPCMLVSAVAHAWLHPSTAAYLDKTGAAK